MRHMIRFCVVLVLAVFVQGCVSKEQHKTLTQAFRAYYDETSGLYGHDIESDEVPESVKEAKRKWLQDAEAAIIEHEKLAGIRPMSESEDGQ